MDMNTKCSQLRDDRTPDRVIVDYRYKPGLKDKYRGGALVEEWLSKYQGKWPFQECLRESEQIPWGPGDLFGFFSELYTATQYLDAGYEAYVHYRNPKEKGGGESYDEATKLLGGSDVLGHKKGAPPDLLVFKGNPFRFVECKRAGDDEEFTSAQPGRFRAMRTGWTSILPRVRNLCMIPSGQNYSPSSPGATGYTLSVSWKSSPSECEIPLRQLGIRPPYPGARRSHPDPGPPSLAEFG